MRSVRTTIAVGGEFARNPRITMNTSKARPKPPPKSHTRNAGPAAATTGVNETSEAIIRVKLKVKATNILGIERS